MLLSSPPATNSNVGTIPTTTSTHQNEVKHMPPTQNTGRDEGDYRSHHDFYKEPLFTSIFGTSTTPSVLTQAQLQDFFIKVGGVPQHDLHKLTPYDRANIAANALRVLTYIDSTAHAFSTPNNDRIDTGFKTPSARNSSTPNNGQMHLWNSEASMLVRFIEQGYPGLQPGPR
ncbi:hypothetical protein SAMN04490186_5500 [Pseudomonas grimontii]|uniref:Uncharacterized protein n=2 Tax=Pseudomonas grimontii TaxID=129847 RepID=A0ABY0TTG1_9PSED|nr:hypothetical protein SAMN04490186_5500 [Pseudomonas grimontii]